MCKDICAVMLLGLSVYVPYEWAWVTEWDKSKKRFTFSEDDTCVAAFTREDAEKFCKKYWMYNPRIVECAK